MSLNIGRLLWIQWAAIAVVVLGAGAVDLVAHPRTGGVRPSQAMKPHEADCWRVAPEATRRHSRCPPS
jgi:hypothetical protein